MIFRRKKKEIKKPKYLLAYSFMGNFCADRNSFHVESTDPITALKENVEEYMIDAQIKDPALPNEPTLARYFSPKEVAYEVSRRGEGKWKIGKEGEGLYVDGKKVEMMEVFELVGQEEKLIPKYVLKT